MGKSKKEAVRSAHAEPTAKTPFPKGVSKPALRALAREGYENLGQLSAVTEASLLRLHGLGPNALTKLREALQEAGLSFANTDPAAPASRR
jgi:hypothetical protein